MSDKVLSILLHIIMICVIPIFITTMMTGINTEKRVSDLNVKVQHNNQVLEVGLEEYIIGVVAAEMPASYDIEALKAQSVCVRTFTLKHLEYNQDTIFTKDIQSYLTEEELKEVWSVDQYSKYYSIIEEAVENTKGVILTYNNELISAVFHGLSAGYTRDANDIWGYEIPYLVSCNSQWDKGASNYHNYYELEKETIMDRLSVTVNTGESIIGEIDRDDAGYVKNIHVGEISLSGEEFRNYFNLSSANFNVNEEADTIYIESFGYGHGVGLSQYGANELAKEGNDYEDILKYYYKDIEFGHY